MAATLDDVVKMLSALSTDLEAFKAAQAAQHKETLAAIAAVSTRVDTLQATVGELQATVGELQATVGVLQTSVRVLEAAGDNDRVRLANSLKAHTAPLQTFVKDRNGDKWPAHVAQPPTLLDLAVAGNENKPGMDEKPAWNKAKSKAFLKTAVSGFESDGSDGEGEGGAKARTMRMKIIQTVGGNVASVFATQYELT